MILYPEEDQVEKGDSAPKQGGFGGAQWAGMLREGKQFFKGKKEGGFFPFNFNCPFTLHR